MVKDPVFLSIRGLYRRGVVAVSIQTLGKPSPSCQPNHNMLRLSAILRLNRPLFLTASIIQYPTLWQLAALSEVGVAADVVYARNRLSPYLVQQFLFGTLQPYRKRPLCPSPPHQLA